MNRHQVLTGACNYGDQCFAVGSVEGVHFTAYATGCDIVILASDFQRVQIIPGVTHGNIKVSCIDCSKETGKIAASYHTKVYIFEPTPLIHHESSHKLDYKWFRTAVITTDSFVHCLSWNLEGSKLLTGGDQIQLWEASLSPAQPEQTGPIRFHVGETVPENEVLESRSAPVSPPPKEDEKGDIMGGWGVVWSCRPATPVFHLKFSPDGLLFASAGQADRLVKIWYENRKLQLTESIIRQESYLSPRSNEYNYSFVYISHPRAVTGFDWRKTSKYMPRGALANMLVTSCKDNICRIWCETILPDDGLVNLEQLDPSFVHDPKFHTHRHKKRFMHRLRHIRHSIHKRKKQTRLGPPNVMSLPNISSSASIHDFHKFGFHQSGLAPSFHFHLAASINPETDIPLLPTVGSRGHKLGTDFRLHWLNNKELQFSIEAETILQELHRKSILEEGNDDMVNHTGDDNAGDDSPTDDGPSDELISFGDGADGKNEQDEHTESEPEPVTKRKRPKLFKRSSRSQSSRSSDSRASELNRSFSNPELSTDDQEQDTGAATAAEGLGVDELDRKIEGLLRDWHQCPDMLYSIHPVDGSYLVWLVDWLDEYTPFCFRQAQVSFSSRIPQAFPVPDSRSMAANLMMYCSYSKMDIKSAMKMSESRSILDYNKLNALPNTTKYSMRNSNMLIPNVSIVSKHVNGTLNQWQISFAENSKFATVLSVAHVARACGHRFRTNSAACHPVLPLLLTTSHHNIPEYDDGTETPVEKATGQESASIGGFNFCSELILWRVDPVGPLSKSGGIVELARINSPDISAFSNVAWIPTLLPSTTLGSYSNSPSALFVASDGVSLRMYQAVIDARTLLMEIGPHKKDTHNMMSMSSSYSSSGYSETPPTPLAPSDIFRIISLQSTSRPGCIMELDALSEACQDWQQTQLLHVFQEQLIVGRHTSKTWQPAPSSMEAMVDLQSMASFEENFYLVVLEGLAEGGSVLHMWNIVISSQPTCTLTDGKDPMGGYVPDATLIQEDDYDSSPSSRCNTPDLPQPDPSQGRQVSCVKLSLTTTKVCSQKLPLFPGVNVVYATVAAGHLGSSSIYPACFAPYLLSTACSDGKVRFWRCDVQSREVAQVNMEAGPDDLSVMSSSYNYEMTISDVSGERPSLSHYTKSLVLDKTYDWREWDMVIPRKDSSIIPVPGRPICVSCAYSGRVAIAYRYGNVRAMADNPESKFVNLCVAIYECESTGGSEWSLEDTIELKNISIPDPGAEIDLNMICAVENERSPNSDSRLGVASQVSRTKSIPSLSTIQSVRRSINEQGNKTGALVQKHLVQLDWVSTEDGSHVLTVGVGSKIIMYSQVSNEIAQVCHREGRSSTVDGGAGNRPPQSRGRPMLQKSKTMVVEDTPEEIRWMKLRMIDLGTADGLPSLPMHMSWVRSGILVVGMDNEMHVYSQWKSPDVALEGMGSDSGSLQDRRNLTDHSLSSLGNGPVSAAPLNSVKQSTPFKTSQSMPGLKYAAMMGGKKKELSSRKATLAKSESTTSLSLISESGLFEAAHRANPVLPQYHPKQLMELLNFGKVKRVKAILAHLVRCIAGNDAYQTTYHDELDSQESRSRALHRQRTMSVSGTSAPELTGDFEPPLDYVEISSIPPLPIHALLAADSTLTYRAELSPSGRQKPTHQDYSDLFATNFQDDEMDDPFSDDSSVYDPSTPVRGRQLSGSWDMNYFGPAQGRLLAKHLTYTHLPGLSSLDQMYLLALGDTVANTKTDFSDRFAMETAKAHVLTEQSTQTAESMDDCGLRFMLAMRHHIYLVRTLPPRQRVMLKQQGLKMFNIVWAFHSEATEELLALIPSMQKGAPTWEELRQFGAGWWVYNINILKLTIEKVAKAAFQANNDPLDAAVFYLALKKKNVLWGLFRSVNDKRMSDFFKNNFQEDRWRKAALKNAFALLGRQRFMHAAAFFLLGGALHDAVEVCTNKLKDVQLALVICRLHDYDDLLPSSVKGILYDNVLGCDNNGQNYSPCRAHPDPFLRSMGLWLIKDYTGALNTLLQTGIGQSHQLEDEDLDTVSTSPNVFNFYNYLRTHPLLVRQRLATLAQEKKKVSVVLSGFSHSDTNQPADKGVHYIDKITPLERRLFFQTAHMHFKAGCPALALEVLSKLPSVVVSEEDEEVEDMEDKFALETKGERCIETGTISEFDDKPLVNGFHKASDFDWNQTSSALDWSQSLSSSNQNSASAIDWSQSLSSRFDDNLELDLDLGSDKDSSEKDVGDVDNVSDVTPNASLSVQTSRMASIRREDSIASGSVGMEYLTEEDAQSGAFDIMAQQYKFIACLKILMEELTTLATGFEVDGGQLRYQLYIWLEREVEALKLLCNYRQEMTDEEQMQIEVEDKSADDNLDVSGHLQRSLSIRETTHKPTLHEVILAETMNFEAKLERMSRRRQWLSNNQQLLRTLISYCVLQGSGGGGLASIRMELILLLQELQQVKPQQQLLSPLPFPTTLPLLSASIASSKTVIADPIKHLQGMIQDLLHTIVEFTVPPCHHYMSEAVLLLRNLSVALSSCIYQCLCDSDSFVVSMADLDVAMEGFTSHSVIYQGGHLMAGVRHKRRTSSTEEIINTSPAKWPGVGSLRVLLAREKDEDAPKLTVLLCEALVGVYISLLINAMATYDAHMLYRVLSHKFTEQMWAALFGGGVKTLLKVANPTSHQKPSDDLAKQRMKLNMKIMGNVPVSSQKQDSKRTFKEQFVPPELSMVTYFMTKPFQSSTDVGVDYDSEETLSSEDEDSEEEEDRHRTTTMSVEAVQEHIDPGSYSWCLMRYAIVQLVLHNLETFLPLVGIELQDLPVCSPLLHAVLKSLEQWQEMLKSKLDMFNGPPDNYIPDIYLESYGSQPFAKYRALLEPHNTPFVNQHSSLPVRRLWHQLMRHETLQDVFIRYIFKKKRPPEDLLDAVRDGDSDISEPPKEQDPVKIIHKEQDIISAFTLNQANPSCVTLSTQKELVELDISAILDPPAWLDDDTEYDIELMRKQSLGDEGSDFLVVQVPQDRKQSITPQSQFGSQMSISSVPQSGLQYSQSGRGSSVADNSTNNKTKPKIIRRPVIGVRRIASHPHLPHYLTGSADGSVRMWEWGHGHSLTTLRQPGSFPKVTKVLYNTQGNKCCVSDAEGSVCLWQVGPGSNFNKPIMSLPCHNKTTSDFAFVGSSSMIVTAGHSSESKNVCLWDTLLPARTSLVHAFVCHEHGSPALLYAPQHQVVISGGRKGEICIFDIRQRQMRHTFQAHEGPIKCLALDPDEEYFITGSAEGDIKVWGLDIHQLIHSFVGEHSKNTFFRNMGSAAGVTQLTVGTSHTLFSCGVDGSMKVRQLPEKDIVVHQWHG